MANNTYTFPSVVIQSFMTFTAKRWGQFPTITIVDDVEAGLEFCTMDASWNITIHIDAGESTMLQVKTAVQAGSPSATNTAVAGDLVSLVITNGHNSDTVTTATLTSLTGAVGPNDLSFYVDNTITPLTASFVYFTFNNVMRNFHVYNDETSGAKSVIFSFDGVNVSGQILPTENAQLFDINASGVFLKYGTGAPVYRVFATGPR